MILGSGPAPDAARQALRLYLSQQSAQITPAHIAAVATCWRRARGNALRLLRPATLLNAQEALALPALAPQRPALARLLAACAAPGLGLALVRSAATTGACELPSAQHPQQPARCQESWEAGKGLSALRFEDGAQSFFLLQNISSADSLYLPQQHVLIYLAHARLADVRLLYSVLLEHFAAWVALAQNGAARRWGGVTASHARPAHFYYEALPAVAQLAQDAALATRLPQLIARQDHDFYDWAALYPQLPSARLSSAVLSQRTRAGEWFLHLGGNPHQRQLTEASAAADAQLLSHALAHPSAQAQTLWAQVQGCTPLVWVGLEGQKRCWLEQVSGLAYVLAQLAQQFPQLGVVVDGWTLPLTPSERSLAEAGKDLTLARQLLAELAQRAPGVRSAVVVGANSATKLYLASRVDFFISNFASGSLHVSRLAGKPGFCHLSRALVQHSLHEHVQQHPHRQVYLLPQRWVRDAPERAPSWPQTLLRLWQRWRGGAAAAPEVGEISYSIRPPDFWAFIQPRVNAILAPAPARVQLFLEPSFAIHPDVRQPIRQACHGRLALVFPTLAAAPTLAALAHWPAQRLQNTLVYGLFAFGDEAALKLPCDWLLWLGEPLRRTQLHAAQFVQNARQAGQNLSLEDVLRAQHKALDNYYTRLLSGQDAPFGHCTPAMLAQALLNLREKVRFIGLDEDQAGSFARLCAHMDWDADLFPQQLPERLAPPPEADAPALQAHWPALVALDVQLYAAARQLLHAAPS